MIKSVYIPNLKPNYDISDTERFGKVVPLTEGIVDISNLTDLAARVVSILKGSKEDDYLIIGGAPLVNAIAFFYLISVFGRVNLLIFDSRTRRYMVKTLSEQEIMV